MDAPAVLYALRWLIKDTFRQALMSRVFWILLGLSGVCIVFCLGVSIEGGTVREGKEIFTPGGKPLTPDTAERGRVSLLFGAMTYTFTRDAEREIRFLLNIFASWVGGIIGVLATLVFTAGFIPEALQPSAASVLLAKPVPRWLFLTGKYLGVVCFVLLHAIVFFAGTWLALGLTTNHWHAGYLLGIPLMVFHFATVFSFTLILAALFRSPTACVVGGLLFWGICFAVNYGRHFAVVYADMNPTGEALPRFTTLLSEIGYWCLPKPIDFAILLEQSLDLGSDQVTLLSQQPFETMIRRGFFEPIATIISSCLFTIFALWTAASQLAKTDY